MEQIISKEKQEETIRSKIKSHVVKTKLIWPLLISLSIYYEHQAQIAKLRALCSGSALTGTIDVVIKKMSEWIE